MKRFTALILAAALLASGCSVQKVEETTAAATEAVTTAAAAEETEGAAEETGESAYDALETVNIGLVASQSGSNKTIGQFVINGVELAIEEINANGGVLGKQLSLVIEDEGENSQSAVNATQKLLARDDISAIMGPTTSSYCLAVSPFVLEHEIPFMAGGSSANIPLEQNPYVWQNRMTDDQSGLIMARACVDVLGIKNPAIIYSTESFGTGLKDQTVAALSEMGVEVDENNIYGFNADERQFQPILTQILNSDVDGLIAACHTNPASLIVVQANDVGLELPCIGSNAFSSIVCREAAKELADGWYSITDWTENGQEGRGKEFAEAYRAKYGEESDLVSVSAYDQVYILANAIETAGSADPQKINDALGQISDFDGAMSVYTYHDTHCLATSQLLTVNEDTLSVLVEKISID
ncbi:MAG TPA: ABC transporter substrate-binding protein [Candidatus Avilachnospira avistercoris]|nr:ABC transporter substrate-binding protein [Candidatus Avilachnospira avistercoris]